MARDLVIDNLTVRYGAKTALDGLTLTVPAGEMLGVIGRSGAGKSTLLRAINRLTPATAGAIRAGDLDVLALHGRPLRAWRAETAMIFQQFNLVPRLDVLTNVLIGGVFARPLWRSLLKAFTPAERTEALLALERVELVDAALQRADTLSGGQQQRVAIARALLQHPATILADEPIASLDPVNADAVMTTLRRINREDGITVIANLHDLDYARAYCDRLVGLQDGRVVFDGPPGAMDSAVERRIYGEGAGAAALALGGSAA